MDLADWKAMATYAGLFAEYHANNRMPAEDAIWAARAKVRPQSVLKTTPPTKNPEPTRGLEPRTPSLRVSADAPILAFLSHILGPEMCSNHLRFAELGTYFGTRFPEPIRASPCDRSRRNQPSSVKAVWSGGRAEAWPTIRTPPSKTSGSKKALISFSCVRWRSACAS